MSFENLTPQLRTRLTRGEKTVGWFVGIAVLMLAGSFVYYIYYTAKQKGWFLTKAPYFTFVESASGIQTGDEVKLMGFSVGEISKIEAMPADDPTYNVYVEFFVKSPYYGYLWSDSRVKVVAGDFLGRRYLEVTKGFDGRPSYQEKGGRLVGILDGEDYKPITQKTKPFWLLAQEDAGLNDRVDELLTAIKRGLPGVFALTNQIDATLTKTRQLTAHLDEAIVTAQPTLTNLARITRQLRSPAGSLGTWLIPTNLNQEIHATLKTVQNTLGSADQNVALSVSNLNLALNTIATLTSNLNAQVTANTNILSEVSSLVVGANDFMQRLRGHWLLRSAFRKKRHR